LAAAAVTATRSRAFNRLFPVSLASRHRRPAELSSLDPLPRCSHRPLCFFPHIGILGSLTIPLPLLLFGRRNRCYAARQLVSSDTFNSSLASSRSALM